MLISINNWKVHRKYIKKFIIKQANFECCIWFNLVLQLLLLMRQDLGLKILEVKELF